MDPLSCLAIAGAVVQFLDFGCKIIAESSHLYQNGESKIRRQAEAATNDLHDFTVRFDATLAYDAKDRVLTEEEQDLKVLCVKCKTAAETLIAKLDALNVKEKHRIWNSLATALSNVWSKKDILRMQDDLNELRLEINTRLTGLIRNAVNSMATQKSLRFNALDEETQQIVKGLLDLRSSITEELKAQRLALVEVLNRQETVVKPEANQVTSIVVNVYDNGLNLDHAIEGVAYEACQLVQEEETRVRRATSTTILESLRFSMISQRMEDVTEAHDETFEWIFNHPSEDPKGRKWDDFVQWLETGNGIYWINGKAGSGKSTLLKLVCQHPQTQRHLAIWKGDLALHVASFFFWSSGTSLQKSQQGLLRSLLFDILCKVPGLIPILFPSQWAEQYLQELDQPIKTAGYSWNLSTLTRAFETLLVQKIVPMKLCIFVDGLDEYSGLSSEIAKLFKTAAQAPNVKVCASSRPLLVFKESFRDQPQLRLESLTVADIEKYVVSMLNNDKRMQKQSKEAAQMKELVNEIVDSASGVFLWVKLIVIDLLKGLENHDSISQLQSRLRCLPTDLEELYEHMVFKVASVYRVEASRFYQLVAACSERDDDWHAVRPLAILTLFFAEKDKDFALQSPWMYYSAEDIQSGISEVDLRLRSRCGGLIETQFSKSDVKDVAPEMRVSYIHRTVKDYLEGTGIRHILSDRTGGLSATAFNPHRALMCSYILQVKSLECLPSNSVEANSLFNEIISYARQVEWDLCEPNTALLQCFFDTAMTWWRKANPSHGCILSDETIVTLAVKAGLSEFLKAHFKRDGILADATMLNCALTPDFNRDMFVSKAVIETLVDFGAPINQLLNPPPGSTTTPQSPWQNALSYLADNFRYLIPRDKDILLARWERILKILLQNGAVPTVQCRGPARVRAQRLEEMETEVDASDQAPGARIETILTAREVVQKTFEDKPDMLSGLLRILDSKVLAAGLAEGSHKEPAKEEVVKHAAVVKISQVESSKESMKGLFQKAFRRSEARSR